MKKQYREEGKEIGHTRHLTSSAQMAASAPTSPVKGKAKGEVM